MGLLAYVALLLLTMWTWLVAIPRVSVRMVLRVLDVFESTMLTFVWEYQGDNILKYLFEHHYIQSRGAVVCAHSSAKPHEHCRSQTTQTENSPDDLLARRQIETLDKLVTELVPGLLRALSELPMRVESGWQLVHGADKQSSSLSSVEDDLELQPVLTPSTSGQLGAIEAGLQSLVDKIGKVDNCLSQLQHAFAEAPLTTARHTADYNDQLTLVVSSLSAVKEKCEAECTVAMQLVQSLAALDATLANIDTLPCKAARQVADAIMQTDEADRVMSRNDSVFTELAETQVATPTHIGNEHVEMVYSSSSSSSISTDDDAKDSANDADASTSDSGQCSVRSLKSLQLYTGDHVCANAVQEPPFTAFSADPVDRSGTPQLSKQAKEYKFSIKRGIKRYSWFRRKPQPSLAQE